MKASRGRAATASAGLSTRPGGDTPATPYARTVLDVVDRIPRGKVMTYGDVAEYLVGTWLVGSQFHRPPSRLRRGHARPNALPGARLTVLARTRPNLVPRTRPNAFAQARPAAFAQGQA